MGQLQCEDSELDTICIFIVSPWNPEVQVIMKH